MIDKILCSKVQCIALLIVSNYLQSPHLFVTVTLSPPDGNPAESSKYAGDTLAGQTVSSLNKLRDVDNSGTLIHEPD
jgi:hypothetical protein